ncbi:MAG: hypothetical protein ACSHX3_11260 [Litorimonas sp.]
MNIIATTMMAGAFAATPLTSATSLTDLLPGNPFDGLSVSAAGIGFEVSGDGIETHPAATADFEIELRLKSGSPIRVRL